MSPQLEAGVAVEAVVGEGVLPDVLPQQVVAGEHRRAHSAEEEGTHPVCLFVPQIFQLTNSKMLLSLW